MPQKAKRRKGSNAIKNIKEMLKEIIQKRILLLLKSMEKIVRKNETLVIQIQFMVMKTAAKNCFSMESYKKLYGKAVELNNEREDHRTKKKKFQPYIFIVEIKHAKKTI